MAKRGKLRVLGNDRFFMMLSKDIRRRWMQYGVNRKLLPALCEICGKSEGTEVDHITPAGPRPRRPEDFSDYIYKILYGQCQRLCSKCHLIKTNEERRLRKLKKGA